MLETAIEFRWSGVSSSNKTIAKTYVRMVQSKFKPKYKQGSAARLVHFCL